MLIKQRDYKRDIECINKLKIVLNIIHQSRDSEKYTNYEKRQKELAYLINEICPNSREKSLAITNLEQVVMWANASIARNEVSE
ncbi:DUF7681 family protein [Paenibacillus larvae]|uniref:Acb2/Tad1 domain-containing protein n=1 Tax=Paenibacillus larvae TaxID=1464 RepID=UPI00288C84DD|nr:hypothetical protein [Paenibacillus larvae]MDT2194096.1 hypothetical protein [Paenibacillus larvae]